MSTPIPCNGKYKPTIDTICNYKNNIPQLTIGKNNGPGQIDTHTTNSGLYTKGINIPLEIYTGILCTYVDGDAIYFKNISNKAKKIFVEFNMEVDFWCQTTSKVFPCTWGFHANGYIKLYINYGGAVINNKIELGRSENIKFDNDCGGSQFQYTSIVKFNVPLSNTIIDINNTFLFTVDFYCESWTADCICGPITKVNLNYEGKTLWQILFFNFVDA